MHTWADVAVLAKTRNMNGRFAARAAAGLPFLLQEGMEVAFVPPVLDAPRRATVAKVSRIDGSKADVSFEGIGEGEAQLLVGAHCLVLREEVDATALDGVPALWEGMAVVDEVAGEIGRISGVIENPGQMLLEVKRPDGALVLVPAVGEIVKGVDSAKRVVGVHLPNGLLDL